MREIKFRVWDTGRKEWVHDTAHAVNLFGEYIIMGEILRRPDDTAVSLQELINLVPMQFTGLRDKNGKEIYEGDIVKDCFGQVNEITFGGGSFWFNWLEMPHYLDQVERGEVIGNVWENPELLGAK